MADIDITFSNGYSITKQPSALNMGQTFTVQPPSIGCNITFNPAVTQSGSSSPSTGPYWVTLLGTFTTATETSDYSLGFSVEGANKVNPVNGRPITVSKTHPLQKK